MWFPIALFFSGLSVLFYMAGAMAWAAWRDRDLESPPGYRIAEYSDGKFHFERPSQLFPWRWENSGLTPVKTLEEAYANLAVYNCKKLNARIHRKSVMAPLETWEIVQRGEPKK